ncbi:response regulator [Candidatus Poribacteria bacterium]|nr:response regulator [Candidatus Poribacteria bacterium]
MDKHRILIVDDDKSVRSALKRVFAETPYIVLEAENPKEALAALAGGSVSVIITDEKMPGYSGLDFVKLVKRKCPEAVRIMLTGYANTQTVISAINDGEIFRFFTKPWNDSELVAAVRQAVDSIHEKELESSILSASSEPRKETEELETHYPGITKVLKDDEGYIILEDDSDSRKAAP